MSVLIWAGALALLLFSATPYIPKSLAVTDLPSHFVLQWAIGAMALMGLALIFRVPGPGIYVTLIAAYFLCIGQMWPYLAAVKPMEAGGSTLKILQANVWIRNKDAGGLKRLILEEKPDIVAAAEVHEPFAAVFHELKDLYPHQYIHGRRKGIAVLSKLPLEGLEEKYLASPKTPTAFFRVKAGGREIGFAVMHTPNPVYGVPPRDAEMAALAEWHAREKPGDLVVAGDLNSTPYCRAFKDMARRMDLKDARQGRGLYGSFPSRSGMPFLRIPIDHVLVSGGLGIADFRLGPDIGSDHLPTLTVIRL